MQMNLMDIIGPVVLFIGVICVAAALYFVITLIKGAAAPATTPRRVLAVGRMPDLDRMRARASIAANAFWS